MKKNNAILATLQEKKEYTKQIVITSILIGVGVNTLTNGIIGLLGIESYNFTLLISGIILSIGAVIYNLLSSISKLNKVVTFDGCFIYDIGGKSIIPVKRYGIVEDMIEYLNAAFSENKAIQTLWESSSISEFKIVGGKTGERAKAITTESGALFIELLEYCIIEKLSTHLCDYFNKNKMKNIHELSRKEIPDILLENRFLKQFSEDMKNREAFLKLSSESGKEGKIVTAYNSSGAIYKRFDLSLPAGSKVTRKNKNFIEVETDMFTLRLGFLFGGFNTILPRSFLTQYIGISDLKNIKTFQFNVEVSIKFKPRAVVSSRKWMYYAWADEFIERMYEYISKDYYLEKINWSTVQTILECQQTVSKT